MKLAELAKELENKQLSGFWRTRVPSHSPEAPFLWKWEDLLEGLMKASETIGIEQAERRAIRLVSPHLPIKSTSHTLQFTFSIVNPGEVARTHRHNMAAIRFVVQGKGAYSRLKFEGGVHRVQRVPVTETQGRIHTSAVTVAVLPEAEDVEVDLADKELRIDVFRSSGPGGQSVNTTDSAVRATHLPTGLVVTCQDEKSQHKNKAKALKILRARLLERARHEQQSEIAASRRAMVGSGDRSEKIRTYNFPQSRITDHRANLTLHTLERVLDGELDAIIDALTTRHQAEALEAAG